MAKTLKQQIKKVIKDHYGYHLGSFRADLSYQNGIEPFVADLAKILKGKIRSEIEWRYVAKHTRAGSLDAEIGYRLKEIRTKKNITVKELAKRMSVHPDFLEDFERGDQVIFFETVAKALGHLKTTLKERRYVLDPSWESLSLRKRVQDVIEVYFGRSLWFFNPDVSYEESINPFVESLTRLVEVPPLGYVAMTEDRQSKIVTDPVTAPLIRAAFKKEVQQPIALSI